ncbi:MAG: VPLPA-CTERM sorting domain-containing protein [Pseudomonadota bacterium]
MTRTLVTTMLGSVALATAASATTIDITSYSASAFGDATAGLMDVSTTGFEREGLLLGESEVTPGGTLDTSVGSFETVGGTGSGGTVGQIAGNTGTNVAIRDGNVYGRTNTTAGGSYFLDSNDTFGIRWNASNDGALFNTLVFTLMDASEYSFLRVIADGVTQEQRLGGRLGNGNTSIVEISLATAVTSLTVELANFTTFGGSTNQLNDGFSIDDATIGLAPVPVPASLPLLALGAGTFAYLRRQKRKSS